MASLYNNMYGNKESIINEAQITVDEKLTDSQKRLSTINNEQSQQTKLFNDDIKMQQRGISIPSNIQKSERNQDKNTIPVKSIIVLGCVFIFSIMTLFLVYLSFPKMEENEKQYIKVPTNINEAKELGKVLSRYQGKYYYQVLFGYFISYVFLQSFAIPGSISLSVLSGFLFPFPMALFLVCLCSGIGASFCYMLSFLVGRRLVKRYIPERIDKWTADVERQRDNLLYYIIFLRITPILPNWFINISSPILDVPLTPFFIGTFLGVAPPSFFHVQCGQMLNNLTSTSEAFSIKSVTILGIFALISLIPILFNHKLKSKFMKTD